MTTTQIKKEIKIQQEFLSDWRNELRNAMHTDDYENVKVLADICARHSEKIEILKKKLQESAKYDIVFVNEMWEDGENRVKASTKKEALKIMQDFSKHIDSDDFGSLLLINTRLSENVPTKYDWFRM